MPRRILTDHEFEGGATAKGLPVPDDDADAAPKGYADFVALAAESNAVEEAGLAAQAKIDLLPTLTTNDPATYPVTTAPDPVTGLPVTKIDLSAANTDQRSVRTIASGTSGTLTVADRIVLATNVSATRTLTLPTAAAFGEGAMVVMIGDDSASQAHYVQVNAHAGDTMSNGILGAAAVLPYPFWWHEFYSDGVSNWTIHEVGLNVDGTFASASDGQVPSQLAVQKYVDGTIKTVTSSPATVGATDRHVSCGVASGGLVLNLPAASSVPKNHPIFVFDGTGTVSATNGVDIHVNGSDTMTNGFGGHAFLSRSGSWLLLISDGVSNWVDLEFKASTDGTFASASDATLSTSLAIKTFVKAQRNVRTISSGTTGTIAATDRTVLVTNLTAARTLTLPTAAAFGQGSLMVMIGDTSATPTNLLTIDAGSDTLVGGVGHFAFLPYPFWWHEFYSDGVSTWTIRAPAISSDGTFASPTDYESPSTQAVVTYVGNATAVGRVTFSDANYTITTAKYVAQIGTLSANRTVTLPTAPASGTVLTVTDESGTCGPIASDLTGPHIFVVGAGSDTIRNPYFPDKTSDDLFAGYESRTYRYNATLGQWTVINAGTKRPFLWFSHPRSVIIPNDMWTPLPWQTVYADTASQNPQFTTSTTIASGSNAAVLPQGTINVASTSGFTSVGFIEIIGPPGSGISTVIHYSGVTSTSFTDCNSAPFAGISSGTLATGQSVVQSYVGLGSQIPYLYNAIYGASFAKNAFGYRGIRVASVVAGARLSFANGQEVPALNIDKQHLQMAMQPAAVHAALTDGNSGFIEVYQNSGAPLASVVDGFSTPIIMQAHALGA